MRGSALSTLATAEQLAAAGLPVFPVRSDKRPATIHGFKDAVLDPADVAPLWRRHPGPLIGVPTGEASGLDALDIDPRHGGDKWWLANNHLIPATRIHRTGSGGLHALFRHAAPVRNTESKIARGVDTRGEGGYIVWWPAAGCDVVDTSITTWPSWLLARLVDRPRQTSKSRTFAPLDSAEAAQRIAERVLRRVEHAGQGQRYYVLRKSAFTLGGLLDLLPFGETEAIARLIHAAEAAGAEDSKHAERIAKWGLGHGKAKPFTLRGSA